MQPLDLSSEQEEIEEDPQDQLLIMNTRYDHWPGGYCVDQAMALSTSVQAEVVDVRGHYSCGRRAEEERRQVQALVQAELERNQAAVEQRKFRRRFLKEQRERAELEEKERQEQAKRKEARRKARSLAKLRRDLVAIDRLPKCFGVLYSDVQPECVGDSNGKRACAMHIRCKAVCARPACYGIAVSHNNVACVGDGDKPPCALRYACVCTLQYNQQTASLTAKRG